MLQIVLLGIILLPVLFYFWMFWDMSNNKKLPNNTPIHFNWPPVSRGEWVFAFVFFSLLASGYYYMTVYRSR